MMRKLLFVDDLRTLTVADETAFGIVTYARTREAALAVNWREYDEIWLDHDLGQDENGYETDVRYLVHNIVRAFYDGEDLSRYAFRIVTANVEGRAWMKKQMSVLANVTVEENW